MDQLSMSQWTFLSTWIMPHSFPPVEALEFIVSSPILVLLLCSLENNDIVGSALLVGRFFIVDLIE
jgi:hypothetical protein